jgi:acetyltransferase
VGNAILTNILQGGFKGAVYPINPKYKEINGVKAYTDVIAVPEAIDLAIICVPVSAIENIMNQCAGKGIKGIVVITAGFKEVGEVGKELEERMTSLAKKHNMALIGPNCLGIVSTQKDVSLNANFAMAMPPSGNVALISQSGAIGVAALEYAHLHDLGISKFVSIGNKAVLDESDVLDYLIDDPETHIITMYVEDISRPARFLEMARKANAKQKPIIVIKTGGSVRGAVATHSHTGALSTSDTAYDSLFAQCGVIRVEALSELFELAKGFSCKAQPKGNRIVVLTNAGGLGVIATDAAEREGLELSTFETETLEALKKALPPTANTNNPVDIIGDADAKRFSTALSILARDQNMDGLIVCVTPTIKTDMNEIAKTICDFSKEHPALPVLTNLMSFDREPSFLHLLDEAHIPNFDFPEINIRVLAAMIRYYKWIKQPSAETVRYEVDKEAVRKVLDMIDAEKRDHLSEPETYNVLQAYGMKVVNYAVAKDIREAISMGAEITYPLVLKIVSPDIMHKVDVGGVKINIKDEAALKKAFEEISESVKLHSPKARIQGFLVQKYVTEKGMEIIAGANRINGFGALVMFGLGGTFVEIFKDVSFRLTPLSKQDAYSMIEQTKGYQILKGYRGQTAYDIDSIAEYLLRLSQLLTDFPAIKEIDLNPIRVMENGKGIIVMDAKAVI